MDGHGGVVSPPLFLPGLPVLFGAWYQHVKGGGGIPDMGLTGG